MTATLRDERGLTMTTDERIENLEKGLASARRLNRWLLAWAGIAAVFCALAGVLLDCPRSRRQRQGLTDPGDLMGCDRGFWQWLSGPFQGPLPREAGCSLGLLGRGGRDDRNLPSFLFFEPASAGD